MSYELKSARFLAKEILSRAVSPGDAVIDATMGNGHDTLFLCESVGPSGRVYAFDVQEQAVASTEALLRREGVLDRARLFCCGHQHMNDYVHEPVQAAVFNLGWLPGGDHSVTTHWETTREAVSKALDLRKRTDPAPYAEICSDKAFRNSNRYFFIIITGFSEVYIVSSQFIPGNRY